MTSADQPLSASVLDRVLVLIKGQRDRSLTRDLLVRDGVNAWLCADMQELCAELERGAALALLAEECLTPALVQQLAKLLKHQPPWSDFPVIVFSALAGAGAVRGLGDALHVLGNVIFLDRPIKVRSMLAAVHAALRSRQRQYEARRAIESRDLFLAMLGHELRNPLGAIRLASMVLNQKVPESAAPRELQVIDRQSMHLARLVDDLLDVARVTHGKVVLKRERLDLTEVVRSAFENLEPRARERDLAYILEAETGEILVDGDRQRLEQVLSNLLTNAIKYTAPGGTVRVRIAAEQDTALVTVTDTGIGIAPEMLERVFEPFAQADDSLHRSDGGIGLGLALVRSILHLHGGSIEAVSPGVGQGTAFIVRLAKLDAGLEVRPERSSTTAEPSSSALRILVVEDSPDIRELLVILLTQAGHQVLEAEDGPEGLDKMLEFDPELAFIDIGLPGFDGFELARRARASGCTTRLIAVTGYGRTEDKERAVESGFDLHLTKPVLAGDIARAVVAAHGAP